MRQKLSLLERLGINPRNIKMNERCSREQEQTGNAFAFKWSRRNTYESEAVKAASREWLFERYCKGEPKILDQWLAGGRKIILDAGCGSGYSALLFFGDHLKKHDYVGVDISDAVFVAEERFREAGYPGDFLKMNILDLPIPDMKVDMIFSEGVLHHTDDVEKSIKKLAKLIKTGGRFLFYVYARKAVIREYTDDYIREYLQPLSDEEAWNALEPLTKLGIVLGQLNVDIDVPEDIPFLGIKKGRMDLQRFFYWNLCKLYYRPEFTLDEMNHINFDWFRPLNCHRHTPEEIERWCREAGLFVERKDVQESGITVVAVKQKASYRT